MQIKEVEHLRHHPLKLMNEKEMRELDAWIAEHVMGWHKVETHWDNKSLCSVCGKGFGARHKHYVPDFHSSITGSVPRYTTDPAAAMEVLKRCAEKLCEENAVQIQYGLNTTYKWYVATVLKPNGRNICIESDTPETGLCLFAKALFTHKD